MMWSTDRKAGEVWHGVSKEEAGWKSTWKAPQAMLTFTYDCHAMPHRKKNSLLAEEFSDDSGCMEDFCPSILDPDVIGVEVELGPSQLCFSALIIKLIFALKDNYFGECDQITNVEAFSNQRTELLHGKVTEGNWDPRKFRPLHVSISVVLHNIQAKCMLYSTTGDYPVGHVEQLTFEMDKRFVAWPQTVWSP